MSVSPATIDSLLEFVHATTAAEQLLEQARGTLPLSSEGMQCLDLAKCRDWRHSPHSQLEDSRAQVTAGIT
jgi:hypothetical protein